MDDSVTSIPRYAPSGSSMVDGKFFRQFIQPGWDFVAVKSDQTTGKGVNFREVRSSGLADH
jgi:hypothetical protein